MQQPSAEGSTERQTAACFTAARHLLQLGGGVDVFPLLHKTKPLFTLTNKKPRVTSYLRAPLCQICAPSCLQGGWYLWCVLGAARKRKGKPNKESKQSTRGITGTSGKVILHAWRGHLHLTVQNSLAGRECASHPSATLLPKCVLNTPGRLIPYIQPHIPTPRSFTLAHKVFCK